jgi:DNA-binding GntR family transcriptional regulator
MEDLPKRRFFSEFKPAILVEQVSRILTDAILEGVLKGGEQLVEAELQKQFGISRSPLREAFRDLEKKGLVLIQPRRGTFVKVVTPKDVEDHFPVRAALEGLAAREAHPRMTAEDLAEMRQAFRNMERAARQGDARTFREHHLLYHEVFINASGNDILINILRTLRMHNLWYRFSYQYYKEDLKKSVEVHRRILGLFEDRATPADVMERVVREHIQVALERFLEYLQEQRVVSAP